MSDIVLSPSRILPDFILTSYYGHFTQEETQAQGKELTWPKSQTERRGSCLSLYPVVLHFLPGSSAPTRPVPPPLCQAPWWEQHMGSPGDTENVGHLMTVKCSKCMILRTARCVAVFGLVLVRWRAICKCVLVLSVSEPGATGTPWMYVAVSALLDGRGLFCGH